MVPSAHPSRQPKRQLDRFSRFCRTHYCDRQTDRETNRQTVHAVRTAMRPNNNDEIEIRTFVDSINAEPPHTLLFLWCCTPFCLEWETSDSRYYICQHSLLATLKLRRPANMIQLHLQRLLSHVFWSLARICCDRIQADGYTCQKACADIPVPSQGRIRIKYNNVLTMFPWWMRNENYNLCAYPGISWTCFHNR